jgi:uncharacterized protein (DUF305 family)
VSTTTGARQGGPRTLGLVALGSLLVLALVALAVVLLRPQTPGDDSVEAGFARDMSEHHAQAVQMSLVAIQESDSTDIDVLAYDIATAQSNQLGQMEAWLRAWDLPLARDGARMTWMETVEGEHADHDGESDPGPDSADQTARPGDPDYRPMPGMATQAELDELAAAEGEEAEVLYLQLMTTHHIAGVEMAEAALAGASDAEVRRLAEAMVNGQSAEVRLMASMLADRGAEPREDLAALGY